MLVVMFQVELVFLSAVLLMLSGLCSWGGIFFVLGTLLVYVRG